MGDLTWSHGDPLASGRSSGTVQSRVHPTDALRGVPPFTGDEVTAYARRGNSSSAIPPLTSGRLRSSRRTFHHRGRPRPLPRPAQRAVSTAPSVQGLAPPPTGIAYLRRVATCPLRLTAVSNRIIAELWAAAGTVATSRRWKASRPPSSRNRGRPSRPLTRLSSAPHPPDRSATYLKLIKSGLRSPATSCSFCQG